VNPIVFHPKAVAEVTEAVTFYEGRSPGLGQSLLEEVERALEQVAAAPEAYPLIEKRTRRMPLWRFPYSLIYAVYPDRVRIVAFAHQKRRPSYWQGRLKTSPEGPAQE
jgi:plasmid stabilization system protein ParE